MSVAEIKEALHALTPEELAEVAKEVSLLGSATKPAPEVREVKPSDPDFIAAKKKVFEEHRELFRRLAE